MATYYVQDKSKGKVEPDDKIVFGRDTIESLKEKKRQENKKLRKNYKPQEH